MLFLFVNNNQLIINGEKKANPSLTEVTPVPTIEVAPSISSDSAAILQFLSSEGHVNIQDNGNVVKVETKGESTSVYIKKADGGTIEGTWKTKDLQQMLSTLLSSRTSN